MQILGEATKEDLKNQLLNINLEDKNLYDEVYKNQDFIFQFSGSTAAGMVKGAYPQNFNDMISINCLSRPGAGFQFDSFVANQNGESKYPEFIAKFLKDTRGCILTQEEIICIINYLTLRKKNGLNLYIESLSKASEVKPEEVIKLETEKGIIYLLPYEIIKTSKGNKYAKDLTEEDELIP